MTKNISTKEKYLTVISCIDLSKRRKNFPLDISYENIEILFVSTISWKVYIHQSIFASCRISGYSKAVFPTFSKTLSLCTSRDLQNHTTKGDCRTAFKLFPHSCPYPLGRGNFKKSRTSLLFLRFQVSNIYQSTETILHHTILLEITQRCG